jgi:hypothetical protein
MSAPVEDPKVSAVFDEVVDRELADGIVRRVERRLTREPAELVRTVAPPMHLDPDDWGAGFLAVHDRERPIQLVADLQEVSPQASLRDLFRPEMESRWHERIPLEHNVDRGAQQAYAEVRAAQVLEPLPVIPLMTRAVAEEQARRRAWLKETWQPMMTDDQPRRSVDVYREPSLLE